MSTTDTRETHLDTNKIPLDDWPLQDVNIVSKDEDQATNVDWRLSGAPFGLEDLYKYEPGGYLPVHLGDCFGPDDRYRVIHKLGSGGFATVWLCRDMASPQTRFVALKILMADFSTDDCQELIVQSIRDALPQLGVGGQHICLPTGHFRVDGVNGSHQCIVYPLLGPRVEKFLDLFPDSDEALRRLCLQIVQALSSIHACGICHGDITPRNVLLRIQDLDRFTEDEVLQALGQPMQNPVTTVSGRELDRPNLPRYLVYPINFDATRAGLIVPAACIIDFGESFEASRPPKEVGIPQAYRSPELVLDNLAGYASDMWALGCTLFEVRVSLKLFGTYDDEVDDHLIAMVSALGKLPEPWWHTWASRKAWFEDEADEQGQAIGMNASEQSSGEPEIPRSIRGQLSMGYLYGELQTLDSVRQETTEHEVDLLTDLLEKLLNYNPQKRLSAKDAQDHAWFHM